MIQLPGCLIAVIFQKDRNRKKDDDRQNKKQRFCQGIIRSYRNQKAANQENGATGSHKKGKEHPNGFDKWIDALMAEMINSSSEHNRRDARNRKINKKGQTKYESKNFHRLISFLI